MVYTSHFVIHSYLPWKKVLHLLFASGLRLKAKRNNDFKEIVESNIGAENQNLNIKIILHVPVKFEARGRLFKYFLRASRSAPLEQLRRKNYCK
jgi:hypothetical protein